MSANPLICLEWTRARQRFDNASRPSLNGATPSPGSIHDLRVCGLAFPGLTQAISWRCWAIELLLGAIGWLVAMPMLTPMAGKGVFGVALGWVQGRLRAEALFA